MPPSPRRASSSYLPSSVWPTSGSRSGRGSALASARSVGVWKEEKETPQLEQKRAASLIGSLHCGQIISGSQFFLADGGAPLAYNAGRPLLCEQSSMSG